MLLDLVPVVTSVINRDNVSNDYGNKPEASKRSKYFLADIRCDGSNDNICLQAARKAENSILFSFCCNDCVCVLRCRYSIKSPKSKARSPFKNVSSMQHPAENISIAGVRAGDGAVFDDDDDESDVVDDSLHSFLWLCSSPGVKKRSGAI